MCKKRCLDSQKGKIRPMGMIIFSSFFTYQEVSFSKGNIISEDYFTSIRCALGAELFIFENVSHLGIFLKCRFPRSWGLASSWDWSRTLCYSKVKQTSSSSIYLRICWNSRFSGINHSLNQNYTCKISKWFLWTFEFEKLWNSELNSYWWSD